MKTWRPILAAMALLALAACGSGGVGVGNAAPDFTVEKLAPGDPETKLSSMKGKVVLLDFWATWCGPCKAALPHIDALARQYKDQGVVSMAVSSEARDSIAGFKRDMKYDLDFYRDPYETTNAKFEVETIPATFVIGRDGKIVYEGRPADPDELEKALAVAVKEG